MTGLHLLAWIAGLAVLYASYRLALWLDARRDSFRRV